MPDIEFIRAEIERMRLQVLRHRNEIMQLQRDGLPTTSAVFGQFGYRTRWLQYREPVHFLRLKRTSEPRIITSAMGHFRTQAPQQSEPYSITSSVSRGQAAGRWQIAPRCFASSSANPGSTRTRWRSRNSGPTGSTRWCATPRSMPS
jgi:hypothetical protein